MVRTRSSSKVLDPPSEEEEEQQEGQSSSPERSVQDEEEDDEPPKPISSEDEGDDSSSTTSAADEQRHAAKSKSSYDSRLFAPYRTVGLVSTGAPYCLETHSEATFVTLPIHNRIHTLNVREQLRPVLVSQQCGGDSISHVLSNSSLGISICVHDESKVTLISRTKPIQTVKLLVGSSSSYKCVDLLDLGKLKVAMKGEKEGKLENGVLCAVILARQDDTEQETDGIPTVGEDDSDDDDDSSSSSSESDDDSKDDSQNDDNSVTGQVVLLLATRTGIRVQKRIPLHNIQPTVALHPATYLNKIVIGGHDSKLLLLNIRSEKIIHEFQCLKQTTSMITALQQSPAVDTIAVGMANGMVHLINLRQDVRLFGLKHCTKQNQPVEITSLSFRRDGSAMRYNIAPLAVGRSDGTISIWDLSPQEDDGRTLLCEMDSVHPGGVAKLSYLPQEPLLLSTGTHSNSVLLHIFDNPDHSGRVLRQRKGHMSPPKHMRYLNPGTLSVNAADGTDAASCQILSSGGLDRTLRVFSTARSVLDKEYSQGKGLEKKARALGLKSKAELLLPPLTAMATCEARRRDWGDLVTIHRHHAFAYVWSTKRGAQSGPVLRQSDWNVSAMQQQPPTSAHATSVTISSCGNYALVGTQGGTIYKYNVQSGIPRGSYPFTDKPSKKGKMRVAGDVGRTMKALEKKMKLSNRSSDRDKEERDAVHNAALEKKRLAKLALASHTGASVTGLAVDSVNKTLLSVGSDAKLILWNFSTHAPHKKSPYMLPSPATKMCHVRDSDLAAIAMEDFSVVLFDCAALSIVRRFGVGGETVRHTGPISDLGFSPDGRHLFSSSMDGTVRVWDVPTNTCVDWLSFRTPPTSLAVSPTGEFLATTHVDKLGISLWSDRSFYQTVHMDGARPPSEPARMDEPAPVAEVSDGDEVDLASERLPSQERVAPEKMKLEEASGDSKAPPTAKEEGLITLSGLPPSHWKNLFHLELVKERNKPKEAPKKPPSAPFFLQWRSGEALGREPANENTDKTGAEGEANDEEEWAAAWSDEDDGKAGEEEEEAVTEKRPADTQETAEVSAASAAIASKPKKRKLTHHRSHLAALLDESFVRPQGQGRFQAVTDHVATLGPSAIDVSLSTLCNGMHDLEDGLPLLHKASLWLLEACQSGQRYEAVNAYLHRFLYLHATVLAGIEDSMPIIDQELSEEEQEAKRVQSSQRRDLLETISELKRAQRAASDGLREKMQQSLCLLRHFSRMV